MGNGLYKLWKIYSVEYNGIVKKNEALVCVLKWDSL